LTRQILHWVKVPEKHIVIDFDLKDLNGHKALERNLEAASLSGQLLMLSLVNPGKVYICITPMTGTWKILSEYSEGIEVKTFLEMRHFDVVSRDVTPYQLQQYLEDFL
jgi:hypothetical protein